MTVVLFCYCFTFWLKKGVQKRVPQNGLIIRKTHFMGGYPKKPWTHLVIFYEGQLSRSGCELSFAQITVFPDGRRTDGHWFCEARGRNRRFAQLQLNSGRSPENLEEWYFRIANVVFYFEAETTLDRERVGEWVRISRWRLWRRLFRSALQYFRESLLFQHVLLCLRVPAIIFGYISVEF